ncbi:MAG: hypothetical protein K8R36_25825, partial [Planctomycetales bacterium]|nr:hypothetical protein [Planctomycetales bacterium]
MASPTMDTADTDTADTVMGTRRMDMATVTPSRMDTASVMAGTDTAVGTRTIRVEAAGSRLRILPQELEEQSGNPSDAR